MKLKHTECNTVVDISEVIELPDEHTFRAQCPVCEVNVGYVHITDEPLDIQTSGDLKL